MPATASKSILPMSQLLDHMYGLSITWRGSVIAIVTASNLCFLTLCRNWLLETIRSLSRIFPLFRTLGWDVGVPQRSIAD